MLEDVQLELFVVAIVDELALEVFVEAADFSGGYIGAGSAAARAVAAGRASIVSIHGAIYGRAPAGSSDGCQRGVGSRLAMKAIAVECAGRKPSHRRDGRTRDCARSAC